MPAANGAPSNNDAPNSPQTSVTNGVSNGHDSSDGASGQKPVKSKNWRLQKLSWNDIRRPAGAMQNYIAQRQVEMAGEKHPSLAKAVQPLTNGVSDIDGVKEEDNDIATFKDLSTTQMMDSLSRDLVYWQQMITEVNEK